MPLKTPGSTDLDERTRPASSTPGSGEDPRTPVYRSQMTVGAPRVDEGNGTSYDDRPGGPGGRVDTELMRTGRTEPSPAFSSWTDPRPPDARDKPSTPSAEPLLGPTQVSVRRRVTSLGPSLAPGLRLRPKTLVPSTPERRRGTGTRLSGKKGLPVNRLVSDRT